MDSTWCRLHLSHDGGSAARVLSSSRLGFQGSVYAERALVCLLRMRTIVSFYLSFEEPVALAFRRGDLPTGRMVSLEDLQRALSKMAQDHALKAINSVHFFTALGRLAPEALANVCRRLASWFHELYPSGWPELQGTRELYSTIEGPDLQAHLLARIQDAPYVIQDIVLRLDSYLRSRWYPFEKAEYRDFSELPLSERQGQDLGAFLAHDRYRRVSQDRSA